MRIHNVEQGTQEWLDMHLGKPSASRFSKLITAKTGRLSAQSHMLACELAAEYMLGEGVNTVLTQHMQRGLKLEDEAVAWYAFERGVEVDRVGFVTLEDGSAGCSPDGLVGDDGGLEIKCPGPVQHVAYMCEPDSLLDDYRAQVQGGLWICERKWWDLVSWHPALTPVVVRVERDEEFIASLSQAVGSVNRLVRSMLEDFGYLKPKDEVAA